MDDIRLESCHRLAQNPVVVKFEVAQAPDAQPRMAVEAVDAQRPRHPRFRRGARTRCEAVVGGQNLDGVAARPHSLHGHLAAQFVTAQVVRRIEVREGEDSHGGPPWASAQPWRKPASLPLRSCQRRTPGHAARHSASRAPRFSANDTRPGRRARPCQWRGRRRTGVCAPAPACSCANASRWTPAHTPPRNPALCTSAYIHRLRRIAGLRGSRAGPRCLCATRCSPC